jgi:hypothetical protein
MTASTIISVVLILPAVLAQRGNEVAIALGYDVPPGATFATPLSATGEGQPTHMMSHTVAKPGFLALLAGMKAGQVPNELASYTDVFAALYTRVEMDVPNGDANIAAALAATGLQVIQPATSLIGE